MFDPLDWIVLVGYFVGILSLGLFFWRRNRSAEQFTAAGRSLPGWLCGLSIFATYLSSISYLALPGKAFADNWNPLMYSLGIPLAAWIAVKYFVPMYRDSGSVSAYAWFESRFGLWARIYASGFYLVYQVARIGVVMYLMALPMAVLFGWDIRLLIVVTGVVVTLYSLVGGITAVIWADAIQAVVLLAGAAIAMAILIAGLPDGWSTVWRVGTDDGGQKFSLGETTPWVISRPTVWVVLVFGFLDNIRNFGVDQSYVQRYIAAKDPRQAARSVWLGGLLYVPVSAAFLMIGTALFAYYQSHPSDLAGVRRLVAAQRVMQSGGDPTSLSDAELNAAASTLKDSEIGDRVFPHFIAGRLPTGVRGLLIAAVFAAAMSTVSTSLNSSATLVMNDFYKRLHAPDAGDHAEMRVLRTATAAWGLMGTIMALVLVRLTDSALDIWWTCVGVLGGAIVGLFLLGLLVPAARGRVVAIAMSIGLIVIAWMTVSPTAAWPAALSPLASPFHPWLILAVGPAAMIATGYALTPRLTPTRSQQMTNDA